MLTPPELSTDTIIACLREMYGLRIRRVAFLPIGADVNTAVYRADADDGRPYFLKLRGGYFDEVAVAVPAFLHAQGIRGVMAPIATATNLLWALGYGFAWIVYSFLEGRDGYGAILSDAQWVALGRNLRAVHAAVLPAELAKRVPRETYSSRQRDIVEEFDHQIETRTYDDPIARRLAAFWVTKRSEIRSMVERAEQLSRMLRERDGEYVLCHADLHPGNVLLGADDELAIVDWDNPIYALKERDLMGLGGGFSTSWDGARENGLFYDGYGPTRIDPLALAYYRYERIVTDLAEYGAQLFGAQGSVEDREQGLRQVMEQFLPHQVVAIAHQTYERLT